MSNNNNNRRKFEKVEDQSAEQAPKQIQTPAEETVQNEAPFIGWQNFDHFWSACIKNGTPVLKDACIAHLKSTGRWENQKQWIAGAQDFGIPVEK